MRLVMILTAIFFIHGCKPVVKKDPNPIKVEVPKGVTGNRSERNIVIKTTAGNKLFVGDKELPLPELDSLLAIEVEKKRQSYHDTITIVIDADMATDYGVVFQIMRAAKKLRTKVKTWIGD